jgi:hypothetical protein
MVTAHSLTLPNLTQGTTYYYRVTSVDSLNNSTSSPVAPATASFVENAVSVWSSSVTPAGVDSGDPGAVELGMKFRSDVAGVVTGVRYYKAAANTGTHIGNLWNSTGTLLGAVTFTGETASGWQGASFSSSVLISANTTYIVSYYAPAGHYSETDGFFATSGVDNPPLHALANGIDGPNGLFVYGAGGVFPNQTFNSANYSVDLVFVPAGSGGVPPVISSISASPGTTSATIKWTTDTASTSRVDYGTSAGLLNLNTSNPALVTAHTITLNGLMGGTTYFYRVTSTDASANSSTAPPAPNAPATVTTIEVPPVISSVVAVPGSTTAAITWSTDKSASSRVDYGTDPTVLIFNATDPTQVTSHSVTLNGLTTGSTYYYRVTSTDASNDSSTFPSSGTPPASFLESTPTMSIWTNLDVTGNPSSGNTSSVELGLKFRSDIGGYVTGVRFYKGPSNTGVHVGNLWSGSGALLASVTFGNETASGWQQANFSTPVSVLANTTYIISYHAPNGNYSADSGYFAYGVNSGFLHALASGVDGPNGVYVYGSTSGFPTQTSQNSNYWVDVVFTAPGQSDPSMTSGRWSGPIDVPAVALNEVLLRTGKVLIYEDSGVSATLYDPATGSFASVPNNFTNLFCSGHTALPDGRILVIGGHGVDYTSDIGSADVNIFDPISQVWTAGPRMAYRRWYPTATALPDGRVLASSGNDVSDTSYVTIPEVYDPKTNSWTQLTSGSLSVPLYPHMFVLSNGDLVYTGNSEGASYPGSSPNPGDTRTFNLSSQTWKTITPSNIEGDSVMYAPGKIMKSGSSSDSGFVGASLAKTFVIDMNKPSPVWQQTQSMSFPRTFHNLTTLPDGTVLVTGGETMKDGYNQAMGVLAAELWSPNSLTWQTMPSMQIPRLYHSSAILLPDGRVLVAGGGRDSIATDERNAQMYLPPYLFKGQRPTITSVPNQIQYGSIFLVGTPDAANIASVALIRPGAATHAYNQSQGFMNLAFQQASGGITVQAPANVNLAPPGYYMLFLVNSNGVPSVAAFVQLPAQ